MARGAVITPWAEPTPEQCSKNEPVTVEDPHRGTVRGTAAWYPQMGGYVGKCILEPAGADCFDAYVWHDGEFPFGAAGQVPVRLHHCDPEQFARFAEVAWAAVERRAP